MRKLQSKGEITCTELSAEHNTSDVTLITEFQGQTETWIQLETLSQNSIMQVKFDLEQLRCFRLAQTIQGTECQGTAVPRAWCLGISISYGIFRHSVKAGL